MLRQSLGVERHQRHTGDAGRANVAVFGAALGVGEGGPATAQPAGRVTIDVRV